jgi:hypothetical protein
VAGAIQTERQAALWRTPDLDQEIMALPAPQVRPSSNPSHVARLALFRTSADADGCTGAPFVVDAGVT